MSRRSQTEVAVLGALTTEPMTGYTIRQMIQEVLGQFWGESYGQIYPTLHRLVGAGLVAPDAQGRTSGTTFRITPSGRCRLRALLREPIPATPPRNGRLLRLFFGAELGADACVALLEEARAAAVAGLATLEREHAEVEGETDTGAAYRLITISAGLHAARAQIAWAEESLAALRRST